VYQRYRDVRLVGTPPESIGKYGGDTDNWEWPRHTGDFSVFRVYMGKDGKPAEYSPSNLPLKPKHFLPVSLKGLKDGDYAMIYGYPGSTNRYETSFGVKLKTGIENPSTVELRDMRLKHMFEQMRKDPAVKLKLASDYAGIANYWKFFDGESKQLLKYRIYEKKQAEEKSFNQWAKGKTEYETLFTDWEKAYSAWEPYAKHRIYLNEGILGSPLLAFASSLMALEEDMVRKGVSHPDVKKGLAAADKSRTGFLAKADMPSDRRILADALRMFRTNIDKGQHPQGFYEDIRNRFGKLDEDATYAKYSDFVFGNSILTDDARWKAFLDAPDAVKLQSDAAYAAASGFVRNYSSKYGLDRQNFLAADGELGRLYLKGIREMNSAKVMYPDANFTMRVSYGQVRSYQPRDAVRYDYVCTMKGILEKYKPGDYEFDLPAELLDKAGKKDFGAYIDKGRNDLVVSFITTNDITGGNSGSPVINATGELVGLAFDGNYEALSHKIAFDKELNRTICVDVRYVLWCIDKLGGASHLIQELKLMR
ncbi:MAG: S46 family peptidase, partial [Chitinophagia bacterium]|nr:S46 family peptidase [Chitinophagia bacterium]